nr:hypothetical protein [Tanacetum cinerariifolium]
MDTLDGHLLKSYYYKDLLALHFGDICYVVKSLHFQVKQELPLLPAYVPDPMELDEHVPVYVSEPEHPENHVPSDDDMQEDHTDYPADGGDDDDETSDDDDDDDTDDEEPTKDEDDDEDDDEEVEHLAPADPYAVPVVDHVLSPGDTEAFKTDETAMIRMRGNILEEDMPPRRRFILTAPLHRCDVAESFAVARPPRGQYDFVDTIEVGQGLIRIPSHDARTIARAADRAEDVGFVRALHASKHRMMTSLEEVNLRISYHAHIRRQESEDFYTQLHDARTDHRDIRLEIDAHNRALLTRLEMLETQMSRIEWQRQDAKDLAVRQMMHIHVLEARAHIDTVEDTSSSCYRIMHVTRQGTNIIMTLESIQAMIDQALQRNSTYTQDDGSQSLGGGLRRPVQPTRLCSYTDFMKCQPLNFKGTEGAALIWWNGYARTLGHDAAYAMTWGTLKKKLTDKYYPKELALMCTKFLADETKKINKYIDGLPDNIHGNVMSTRPKTLDDAIELANYLMDQKLCTYAERQNDNKRKADDSSRNNQQQQPHKKQNIVRAYTASPGEKKAYTGNLPLCTKCNYHHIRKCAPKCGNYKRYGHTTSDCRVKTNEEEEEESKGKAQGRAYALGGIDDNPNSNVITGSGNNQRGESRLNITSCTKAQMYLLNGGDVFLAHITTKEAKDKSEGKRLEDLPIVRDFPCNTPTREGRSITNMM